VALVNARFEALARSVAKTFGLPEVPMAILPADLDTLPDDEVRRIAAERVPDLLRQLTQRT
jgi:hypothetical protein